MKIVKEQTTANSIDLSTENNQYIGTVNNRADDGFWRFSASMKLLTAQELISIAEEISELNIETEVLVRKLSYRRLKDGSD